MKISYNWLEDYLPKNAITEKVTGSPQKISEILTSVGLEVENLHQYETIKNSLKGLIVAEVLTCEKHPDANKLKVTTVTTGNGEPLQVVCGAPNVDVGQKVILAPVGTTIYPINAEPITIRKAKIRGVESNGMLCAEDEIGLGDDHNGIVVLDRNAVPGATAYDYYKPYRDWVFEIGLTPNHMDAMSHIGVAKDVCAYLSHHQNAEVRTVLPYPSNFKPDAVSEKMEVVIENTDACSRYAGVIITGIKAGSSPQWMLNRLKSIGMRPINNIVDITNFILHETGQPLHAFDADKIKGRKIIVKTFTRPATIITLDEKVRSIGSDDIMICNGEGHPICFGGVFGGFDTGVSGNTTSIFLESAWFNGEHIRKTSLKHNLRTEAALRFEKGVDISNTVNVLKRAALLIKEICGGTISSQVIDIYPIPKVQNEITLQNHYLKKLSGKNYHHETVKNILKSLNFSIVKEGLDEIRVAAPFSNPDITLPADVVEEIMRIDGLDNIEIPASIKISPAIEEGAKEALLKQKVTGWLIGNGFSEIFTNSITNSKYFDEQTLSSGITLINSISEDLDIMRPTMLHSGLESIEYNINRRNADLLFFEFGKVYTASANKKYIETETLAIYGTGLKKETHWKTGNQKNDVYFIKGVAEKIFRIAGLEKYEFMGSTSDLLSEVVVATSNGKVFAEVGSVSKKLLNQFGVRQTVFYASINWQLLVSFVKNNKIIFEEISRFPHVERDLSIILDKSTSYQLLEETISATKISKLKEFKLFDVFESEKIGADKKSLAVNFTFFDNEKTLTDEETDSMMNKIISSIEKNLSAEIRRTN